MSLRLGALLFALVVRTVASGAQTPPQDSGSAESNRPQGQSADEIAQPSGTLIGQTVTAIQFSNVPNEATRSRMIELVAQKIGSPLSRDQVRDSIQKLHETGRFADIRVDVMRQDGGVVLSFVTAPNFFIGGVTVEGAPNRPTANQIVNASKLQLGEVLTAEKLDRGLKNVQQLMAQNGFYESAVVVDQKQTTENQQTNVELRVTPGPQARVGIIKVTGSAGYSQGQIEDIAKLHPGDLVSVQRVSTALRRLRKKYEKQDRWLAQVSLRTQAYRSAAKAVDYDFDIDPGPTVEIVSEGYRISRSVLRKNVPVYEEDALDDDLLNEGRRNLLNYLQGRGYFDAQVELKQEPSRDGKHVRVVYIIDAGSRHRLAKLAFTGNKYFADELLRTRMQVQPATRFFSYGRYTQRLLASDVQGLQDLYRANGFLQIKITSEVVDDYLKVRQLGVTVKVDEGPQTLVSSFHIEGNKSFTDDQLAPFLSTASGQLFSEYNISQDRDTLLNYYFNRGFPNATFEASAKPAAESNRMELIFRVHEGEQIFVDQVLVSGLEFTRPFVVGRELQVKTGDPLSQIDLLKTQQKLYDLGIFSSVDTAVQNPEGLDKRKNVLVEVQEAKRYTFNYGGGLEFQTGQPSSNKAQGTTGVSPRVTFDVTRLNFRGRDHTITLKAHVGGLQQRGLISYDAPRWFNNANWKLSLTAFYDNTVDVTTFTSQRLEGSIQAQQTISRASTMVYRFTFRRVKASNIEVSSDQIPLLSQPVRVGEPGFSYIRDKRDNALETTKGNYTTVDGGVAASYFGSEADFGSILMQNSTYYAFGKNRPASRKYVLARSTRLGLQRPFGNTLEFEIGQTTPAGFNVIPLAERFFSGGGNSHRGFGLNQAGPRDPQSGFPVGGNALFLNNIELRFPPVAMPFIEDNISFAIFHDAGNVFASGHDLLRGLGRISQRNPAVCENPGTAKVCDFNYISHAAGVGVRYKTPIGPVRFDFGYNLNPPAFNNQGVGEHARHFNAYFSIGQTF